MIISVPSVWIVLLLDGLVLYAWYLLGTWIWTRWVDPALRRHLVRHFARRFDLSPAVAARMLADAAGDLHGGRWDWDALEGADSNGGSE